MAVERGIVYGVWFKDKDRGRADPTRKPVGGIFDFHLEKNVADYFGIALFDEQQNEYIPPKASPETSLVEVRGYEAVKTYQLDPLQAPSGTTKKIEGYTRLRGAAPRGRRKTRTIIVPTRERYNSKQWNNSLQEYETVQKIREKSFSFPAFFTLSMVHQFLGCIITKKYPLKFWPQGGGEIFFERHDPGKFGGMTVGAWPISQAEMARGLDAQSLVEAVPQAERRQKSRRKQNL